MSKLYAVLLGGRAEGCNTELHDVVFVTGNSFEETYSQLVNKWFGNRKRLHIDAYTELKFVDGHEVTLSHTKPEPTAKKLFFANFGGYRPGYFGEIHEVNFYAASGKPEVLQKAKQELGLTLVEAHCDDNVLIDDIVAVENTDGHYIHLTPTAQPAKLDVTAGYIKL